MTPTSRRLMATIAQPVAAAPDSAAPHAQPLPALMLGAIGVVYGDIGTSPLYTMKESFLGPHPLAVDAPHILGVLSLIFWSLMVVVTAKYVFVAMRADNKGEGGSFALLSLISRNLGHKKWAPALVMMGVLATCLFYGDAMITPAISVLSAVEGLTIAEAGLQPLVIPIAIAILVASVPRPVARHRQGRRVVRPGDPHLHGRARGARRDQHPRPAGRAPGVQPDMGAPFLPRRSEARLPRFGLGVPRGDGRRNALCRHGSFRAQGDRLVVADAGLSVPDAQLHGPGRAAARPSRGRRQPVLPDGPGLGPPAAGGDRHRGDDHRQPGGDQRRLLGHSPGGPARLPAAAQDASYEREGARPDLHPGGQLGPAGDGHRPRPRFPRIRAPRLGLRDRRHGHDADHHGDAGRPAVPGVELEPPAGGGDDRHLPRRRRHLLRLEHHQDPRRRLVSRCWSRRSASPC